MKKSLKVFLNAILFVAIFGLTVWGVFHGENLGEMAEDIAMCRDIWLLPAVICVFIFILGESVIIRHLLESCGTKLGLFTCFLFSSVGFFFSCVTPSASGGQPMQAYYMKKRGIPLALSSVVLMVVTIIYKAVLVIIGLGITIFFRPFLHHYLDDVAPVFYLGIFMNVIFITGLVMLVFFPRHTTKALLKIVGGLEKLHILKHKEHRLQKLEDSMDIYNETAEFITGHPILILQVFVVTLVQRLALFAVPCFIYKALNLSGTMFFSIMILQAAIAVSVDMLPLPGGMGASETLFLTIFEPIFGESLLAGMVLSRGIGYYSELLISAFFTLVAVVYFSARKQQ